VITVPGEFMDNQKWGNILEVLDARSSVDELAYVFLADGTSCTEIRWTFADTIRNSRAIAAYLSGLGIGIGDRVILALNPSLEYVAAFYGIMQLGAVPVPCFPPLRTKDFDRFLEITADCLPAGIVIDEMYRHRVETLGGRLESAGLTPIVVYADLATIDESAVEVASPARDDLALIQYTSGSTGSPKGVCLTHDNLLSNCEALGRSMGPDPQRVGFSWLPPYHDMGLIGTIILSMYHGWPLVLMSPMHFVQQPRRWLQAITDYRVSITVGPNFSLDLCADALADKDFGDLDLSTVKELYCGAEPIHAETLARFQRATAPVGFDDTALIPCYGMAEATLFVAGKHRGSRFSTTPAREPGERDRTVVSCGEVDAEHTVRIVDTATHTHLDDGVVGEIWVSGRSVAAGYYNQPELSQDVFHARLPGDERDYLRTGDLGFLLSGELFVTGRIKDLIIVDGRNIYPHDVEAAVVRADPAVRTVAAFSIDGVRRETICVVAEVHYQAVSQKLHTRIVEAIRSHVTAEFGVRPHIQLSPKRTIPTTTSGKVRRQQARQMFLANGLRCLAIDSTAAQEYTA
jgi:acyl-CoA synthetase (AMP-forming)/AMP-acid ligase II